MKKNMTIYIALGLILLLTIGVIFYMRPAGASMGNYGEKFTLQVNEKIVFPDFTLTYVGNKQRPESKEHVRLGDIYNFKIINNNDKRELLVGWSAGTGELSPTYFVVNNVVYQVGRDVRDKNGKLLDSNEMMVSVSTNVSVADVLFSKIISFSYWWPQSDAVFIIKSLGSFFVDQSTILEDNKFNIFASVGFGPINHAELRVDKKDNKKKLLTLDIDPNVKISEKDVLKEYSKSQSAVRESGDPAYRSLIESKPWGKISFGFNSKGILTSIVFDSL